MSKKSNVHPDYYKTAGRDRPDDAARARLNRAIAAKATSQQHPDRMGKLYFERPESPEPDFDVAAGRPKAKAKAKAEGKVVFRAGAAGKSARPKADPKKAAAAARKTRPSPAKKSRKAAARPAKKR